ncbi:hypothetical protein ACFYXQ_38980 [Nocardia jiangxiensis]|uniref:Transposase, Mutator family n=1 Tax=Nocardia jiangxiensis TaxID=282685 RepID=A0ABW6SDW9_9NOCA
MLETALEAEMTEHVGYEKHDPAGRGTRSRRKWLTCPTGWVPT